MGVSLDGFVEDAEGRFDWSVPSEEVHRIANRQVQEAGAMLMGRRLFEVMEPYWPDAAARGDGDEVELEFARAYVETPRYVFSDSLDTVPEGVRLVRRADAVAEVERLKSDVDGLIDMGGAELAASMAHLIDEFRLWVNPVLVGAGKRFFPEVREQLPLQLVENRTCEGGIVYLRYER
jgi:dihydrofolate reductase